MPTDRESGRLATVTVRRLPYEKPAVEYVETHADEVLGIGCKAADTIAASQQAGTGCFSVACTDNGS